MVVWDEMFVCREVSSYEQLGQTGSSAYAAGYGDAHALRVHAGIDAHTLPDMLRRSSGDPVVRHAAATHLNGK